MIKPPKLWIPGGNNPSSTSQTVEKHLTKIVRRQEVLSLYREIIRTAKHFHWVDDRTGTPWNKILQQQARTEFNEAKNETDPLIIARLLVTGRDCLQQIHNKFNNATIAAWKRIENDNTTTKR